LARVALELLFQRGVHSNRRGGKAMAEMKVTMHSVTREIEKVQKKLKSIRSRVSKTDQKKIDLQLRKLETCGNNVKNFCRPPAQGFIQMFPVVKK
jgi:hypothetical protein